MRRFLVIALGILVGGFLLVQLFPYGRAHANPAVVQEPDWPDPQTLALAERACFDCHSNETAWPWYSNVAPVSWLVQRDVDEGRHALNFSEWGMSAEEGEEGEEMAEAVYSGEMPPAVFLITHPEARLTDAEKQQLAQGLQRLGGARSVSGEEAHEAESDDD